MHKYVYERVGAKKLIFEFVIHLAVLHLLVYNNTSSNSLNQLHTKQFATHLSKFQFIFLFN